MSCNINTMHIDLFHELLPFGEQRKISLYQGSFHMGLNHRAAYHCAHQPGYTLPLGTICGVGCPVTGTQPGSHLGSYKKMMCSQANMPSPFIKHLKMTELTDRSMYDHTITSVIMCWCGGVGAWLAQTSPGDKAGWRSGCTDKRKWLTLYLGDP